MESFLSFSSLIPFGIFSIVNGEWRIGSCLLSGRILLLHTSLFLSLSLTLHKLEKYSTHFFGRIESTWFGLLFVFPLSFLICFYFCFIVLMVSLCFLFILSYWPRVLEFLGNFWTCLASCLFSVSYYVSLYQAFECLFFFIGLFLCFSVLSAHSFINLVKPWIKYWKLLLFFFLSKSLQRIFIVVGDSWPFIEILKRGAFWLSQC